MTESRVATGQEEFEISGLLQSVCTARQLRIAADIEAHSIGYETKKFDGRRLAHGDGVY